MAIGLFKKRYIVRRHAAQNITDGYPSAPYTDTGIKLNVQPLTAEELQALPEGERGIKRVKTFGSDKLSAANEHETIPADRLYYRGLWYECKSSDLRDNTILRHYRAEFVVLPPNMQPDPPEEVTNP